MFKFIQKIRCYLSKSNPTNIVKFSFECRSCKNPINFPNANAFFIILGVLANNKYTKVIYEKNQKQGARGNQYRIEIYTMNVYLKQYLQINFTAGLGNQILCRVSCKEYIEYLINNFHVNAPSTYNLSPIISTQDKNLIRNTIQTKYPQYLTCFDLGFNS
ncbi:MAG: hypothetical protein KFW21_04700 [Spirochaetota bacterium]|nr:hypothetical protein [Spirochaetota bacterium]